MSIAGHYETSFFVMTKKLKPNSLFHVSWKLIFSNVMALFKLFLLILGKTVNLESVWAAVSLSTYINFESWYQEGSEVPPFKSGPPSNLVPQVIQGFNVLPFSLSMS